MTDSSVRLEGLTRRFGEHTAVDGLTFDVAPGERNDRRLAVAEGPQTGAGDAKDAPAVRIGTGDVRVGGHPVVGVRDPLLGRQQGEECSQRIDREGLIRGQREVLSRELEVVSRPVVADHRSLRGHDLDTQVV